MGNALPTFPYPVIAEPSAFRIMETIQQCMSAWTDVLKRVDLYELADEFGGLDDDQKLVLDQKLANVKPQYQTQLLAMGMDLRPYRAWERFRETYEPHPALTRALVDMKSTAKIPGEVFRRLKHPNPVFLLTEGPSVTFADGGHGRVMAVFVSGAVSKRRERETDNMKLSDTAPGNASILLDTHDPNINSYHLTVVSEVFNADGTQVDDLDYCHLTIPVSGQFTLDELAVATADAGFNWEVEREAKETSRYEYLLGVSRIAISHLLYACSRTSEIDDKPRASRPPAKPKKGQPKPPVAARVRRMGWRIGATIQDTVRRISAREPVGTGKKKAPHMRGAHLHTYLVGPGRQEVEIKWLDPIPVNMQNDDGTTITKHHMR